MGNPQGFRHPAGILNVLPGATRALARRRLAMIVELQRDADDVVAFRPQQGRDDRGIDPAGHGHHHAGIGWPAREIKTVQPARTWTRLPVSGSEFRIEGLAASLVCIENPRAE